MVFTESCLSRNLPFWLVRCLADSKHLFQRCEYFPLSIVLNGGTCLPVRLNDCSIRFWRVERSFVWSLLVRPALAVGCLMRRHSLNNDRYVTSRECFSVLLCDWDIWSVTSSMTRHPIFDHEWLSSVMRAYLGAWPYGRTDSICETRVNQCSTRLTTRCLIYVNQYSTVLTVVGI